MATKTEKQYLDEVLQWEVDQAYCRDSGLILNDSGAEASYVPGTLLKASGGAGDWEAADIGDTIVGFLTTKIDNLADSATARAAAFLRGPALVDAARLLAADQATAADTAEKADIAALGVKFVTEPTKNQSGT